MELPEHEKLKLIQPFSQKIGEFMEWIESQGIQLGRFDSRIDHLVPINDRTETLLASFFEIDLDALEREKVAILDEQRKLNERAYD